MSRLFVREVVSVLQRALRASTPLGKVGFCGLAPRLRALAANLAHLRFSNLVMIWNYSQHNSHGSHASLCDKSSERRNIYKANAKVGLKGVCDSNRSSTKGTTPF